jgi:ribosomal protein L7/L12
MAAFEIFIDVSHDEFERASSVGVLPMVLSEIIASVADQAALLDFSENAGHDITYNGALVGNWAYRDLVKVSLTGFVGSFDTRKKIAAIKAVRNLSGLGLKESKDLVEEIDNSLTRVDLPGRYDPDKASAFETEMAVAGYAVKIN